jgi:hypothetical protein
MIAEVDLELHWGPEDGRWGLGFLVERWELLRRP